jgi:hypothetical protein
MEYTRPDNKNTEIREHLNVPNILNESKQLAKTFAKNE